MKTSCWLLAVGCWLAPAVGVAAPDSTAVETISADSARSRSSTLGPWWIGVWGGAALHSEFDTRLGPRHRDVYMAGIRVGRQLSASPRYAIDYFADVVPLIRSTNNPVNYRQAGCGSEWTPCVLRAEMETETASGYGATPIGLQIRAFPGGRVQPVFGLNLGVAWFDTPVPDPEEKQLNFMGDVTLGVEIRTSRASRLLLGVRQNHTSNANTGRANPGLDSRVLYVGAARSLGRPPQP